MSTNAILDRASAYIWLNARLLERRLFAHLFLGGGREPVLAALRAYQNDDGGFGNALEPDKRAPLSQPIDQEMGLRALDDAGFDAAMAGRACDFLTTITTAEGGVPFTIPSVNAYPRQEWWTAPERPPASVNPTASISGLLHKHGFGHPWLHRATEYCWRAIEEGGAHEVHELLAVALFLEHVPDRDRAARCFDAIKGRIVAETALDTDAPGYVKKPLEWAPSPSSLCRRLFTDDVVDAHLSALAAAQQPDGGWPITWPALSPAQEAEWRGIVTLNALKTLRAYGRLQ